MVMNSSATSYVAATFHPTIGQRAHPSLSNTATPKLGMIPQGIRVNIGLHIAKVYKQQTNTVGIYQVIKELDKVNAKLVTTTLSFSSIPSLHIPLTIVRRPTTVYCNNTNPSQPCEESKTIG